MKRLTAGMGRPLRTASPLAWRGPELSLPSSALHAAPAPEARQRLAGLVARLEACLRPVALDTLGLTAGSRPAPRLPSKGLDEDCLPDPPSGARRPVSRR